VRTPPSLGISVVSLTTDRQASKGCLSECVLPCALSEVQPYVCPAVRVSSTSPPAPDRGMFIQCRRTNEWDRSTNQSLPRRHSSYRTETR